MTSPALLLRTLRTLRARQLAGQLHRRLAPLWEDPARFARRPPPPWPGLRAAPPVGLLSPVPARAAPPPRSGTWRLLNRSAELGWPPDWEAPGLPALWRYHLHYFESLAELGFDEARALACDWIERHRLERGRVGWDAYPTSLRLLNWCGHFFARERARTEGDPELLAALWGSLWLQAEWLRRHLEWHLLGNHLLENGVALAFCGSLFSGPDAAAWRRTGIEVLRRELPEQVLADGGHFERSPMYQARVLYALTAVQGAGDAELRALVEEPVARLADALARLCHPDGEIAQLNDAALGAQPLPAALLDWVARVSGRPSAAPETGVFALHETGYFGAREPAGHYVVCDAAPIGPVYLPGHAHGDLLAFELSLAGRRVVVDAGVFGYEPDERRRWARSTAAHNTVEIDGADQCEFWAAFRVARRGRPRDVRFEERPGGFALEAWHDGYARLAGSPRHLRRFAWHADGVLLVRDRVEAGRRMRACTRLHLHPECRIASLDGARARVARAGVEFQVCFAGPGALRVEPSRHFPEFGREEASESLAWHAEGERLETGFCIAAGAEALRYDAAAGATLGGRSYGW